MVVYRGNGLLVLLSLFVALGLLVSGLSAAGYDLKQSDVMKAHAWPLASAFAAAGMLNVAYGLVANRGRSQIGIERSTGMRVRKGAQHTLYFIPVEIWGLLFLAVAIGLFATLPP